MTNKDPADRTREQVTVDLPPPTDWEPRYAYWSCTVNWIDQCGEITLTGGKKQGHRRIDRPYISVGAEGARINWRPQPGTYDAGSLAAFAGILLAASVYLDAQEKALDEAKAVVDGARFGPVPAPSPPVVLPRRKPRPAA